MGPHVLRRRHQAQRRDVHAAEERGQGRDCVRDALHVFGAHQDQPREQRARLVRQLEPVRGQRHGQRVADDAEAEGGVVRDAPRPRAERRRGLGRRFGSLHRFRRGGVRLGGGVCRRRGPLRRRSWAMLRRGLVVVFALGEHGIEEPREQPSGGEDAEAERKGVAEDVEHNVEGCRRPEREFLNGRRQRQQRREDQVLDRQELDDGVAEDGVVEVGLAHRREHRGRGRQRESSRDEHRLGVGRGHVGYACPEDGG
mmetsp:Transcript_4393/g.13834  ORF Transcript_4393/g.13834 Transcript_4393/m.13834 type:complete len:255 (+) Transcript_4393:522-1286(+)